MKLWISAVKTMDARPVQEASFYAVPVDLPEALATKLLQFEQDKQVVRKYLTAYAHMQEATNEDPTTLEVPACLQEEAKSESPPKKKATVATSKSKSQTKRKATQSKSATSPKTPESNG